MQRVLIVGATSTIATHVARLYAARGAFLIVTSRELDKAEKLAKELISCGADAAVPIEVDPVRSEGRDNLICAISDGPALDVVIIAYGILESEEILRADPERLATSGLFRINAESAMVLCMRLAPYLVKGGTLGVFTSLAGERGRAYNACYGATKAAVTTFLSGYRQHLHGLASLVEIRPGPIETPMTASHKKGWLMSQPELVAPRILKALDRGTPIVRVPAKWNLIMLIVRNLPLPLFHRTRF